MYETLIARLRDEDLRFPVGPLVFSSLVAEHLGNWITPADGFDSMYAGVMRAIPADEALSTHLQQHLADMDFQPGAVHNTDITPMAHDIDAFNKGVDATSGALGKSIAHTPTSAPPAAIQVPGTCPPGQVYNPFWKLFGWSNPCHTPKK